MIQKLFFTPILLALGAAVTALAAGQGVLPAPERAQLTAATGSANSDKAVRSTYVLGPEDQISVRALEVEEISDKAVRIELNGFIRLPLIGRIKAAGLTLEQLEAEIAARLKEFVKDPDVSVSILDFRGQPVSVIGSVKNPGVHQLQGRKTLVEILSLAGGLADDAGHSVKITRNLSQGRIPLKSAVDDPSGQFNVGQVRLQDILEAKNPDENIIIKPNDVISVPRAEMIYVTGQIQRAGGFVLRERETLSVLQALSLAGGLDRGASAKNARILRQSASSSTRTEVPIDLAKIMQGKAGDLPLHAEDILFVPASGPKKALSKAAEAVLQVGTGIAIYRR